MTRLIKKNCSPVGVFPREISSLMVTKWIPKRRLVYLVAKKSAEEKWAKKFLKKREIVLYEFNPQKGYLSELEFEDLPKDSNLLKVIKKNKINTLLTTSKYTEKIKKWSEENKIKIISHQYWQYEKIENKLWFDKFLGKHHLPKPKSMVYRYPMPLPRTGKVVLQKSNSWGGEGTYYLENLNDMRKLKKSKEIKGGVNYLLRQFIAGEPYGISLFVVPGVIAISTIRRQCFREHPLSYKKIFVGIQWIPSNRVNEKIKKKISSLFFKIGKIFYQKNFFGHFNFDFVIDKNKEIFLVECNPRFSAATTQILKFPEVISGIEMGKIFIKNSFNDRAKSQFRFYGYPKSTFKGSLLEIQLNLEKSGSKIIIKKEYNNGVYLPLNDGFQFKSFDIRKFSHYGRELIFYSETKKGEVYKKFTTIATVISNFPLFDDNGNLSKMGIELFKKFRY